MKVCRFALENGLTGLEFAYGIPGSCGGGAFMNAGAYGGELGNVMFRCDHIDKDGNKGSLEMTSNLHIAIPLIMKTAVSLQVRISKCKRRIRKKSKPNG